MHYLFAWEYSVNMKFIEIPLKYHMGPSAPFLQKTPQKEAFILIIKIKQTILILGRLNQGARLRSVQAHMSVLATKSKSHKIRIKHQGLGDRRSLS